jgi:uncharacterized membrane protein
VSNPRSTVEIAGHPIHPMLVPFVVGFLVGAFVTDAVYLQTMDPFWARGSFWLLSAGIVMAVIAAAIGLTDFLGDSAIRQLRAAWWHMAGNLLMAGLSVANLYLRIVNGIEAAAAYMWLSFVVVLLLLFTGWKGWEMVYRGHVGVSDRMHPAE